MVEADDPRPTSFQRRWFHWRDCRVAAASYFPLGCREIWGRKLLLRASRPQYGREQTQERRRFRLVNAQRNNPFPATSQGGGAPCRYICAPCVRLLPTHGAGYAGILRR